MPGEHHHICDNAQAPAGEHCGLGLMPGAPGKTLEETNAKGATGATGFWDRLIFALGVAPDWFIPLIDEPQPGN